MICGLHSHTFKISIITIFLFTSVLLNYRRRCKVIVDWLTFVFYICSLWLDIYIYIWTRKQNCTYSLGYVRNCREVVCSCGSMLRKILQGFDNRGGFRSRQDLSASAETRASDNTGLKTFRAPVNPLVRKTQSSTSIGKRKAPFLKSFGQPFYLLTMFYLSIIVSYLSFSFIFYIYLSKYNTLLLDTNVYVIAYN